MIFICFRSSVILKVNIQIFYTEIFSISEFSIAITQQTQTINILKQHITQL